MSAPKRPVLPPCGHIDRSTQLTEIDVPNTMGNAVTFLVCNVPTCREYCRAYIDLRDPEDVWDDVWGQP